VSEDVEFLRTKLTLRSVLRRTTDYLDCCERMEVAEIRSDAGEYGARHGSNRAIIVCEACVVFPFLAKCLGECRHLLFFIYTPFAL
jgi:hypothetical protein